MLAPMFRLGFGAYASIIVYWGLQGTLTTCSDLQVRLQARKKGFIAIMGVVRCLLRSLVTIVMTHIRGLKQPHLQLPMNLQVGGGREAGTSGGAG